MKKHKLIFFGTPFFSAKILEYLITLSNQTQLFEIALVITQPDSEAGRGKKLQASAVKEVALKNNLNIFQPINLKREADTLIQMLEQDISLAIVVAYGQILPSKILEFPKLGCLNIHASLLPRWRGAAPIQRAIISGDIKTGICLMKMDKGLDTGPVCASSEVEISSQDTFATLHDKLLDSSIILLKNNLPLILDNQVTYRDQSEQGITYAHKIENFECKINWNQPAKIVVDQIRGLSPFPGAYSYISGKRLKFLKAEISDNHCVASTPGSIKQTKDFLMLATSDFWINILEVQPEGKKAMTAKVYINGLQENLTGKVACENL